MRYVYFTKTLQKLNLGELIAFCKEVGLDGVDLAVRPGYPVHPDNALKALPDVARQLKEAGLTIGLVSAPTNLTDPGSRTAKALFDACARAEVPALKLGYFAYSAPFDDCLKAARRRLDGFAKLAQASNVKACYHTHSGSMLGNNAAGLRLLLEESDPHHVGAFFDTGHTAVNGGPARMEVDLVRRWLALVAIKDMAWAKHKAGWSYHVVPVGQGIVKWPDVGRALKDCKFAGTISLHGEYEAEGLGERKRLAKDELAALKRWLGGGRTTP
ncbi:MAG: sugar phosphate isomerase/epimerase family protein [Gemmataceae bacterium]